MAPSASRQAAPKKWQDGVTLVVVMVAALDLSLLLRPVGGDASHASLIHVLGVLIVSRFTTGYLYGILSSISAVVVVNYAFLPPYYQLDTGVAGYPLAFLTMFSVSIVTSALTSQIKEEEQIRIEAERERLRANLLRAVGHDLRTPLTSILGSAAAILENQDTLGADEKRTLLENVHSEAQWMIRMVENLLSITKVGGDFYRIQKTPEVAEEVLGEVVEKFQKRFPQVAVEVAVPDAWLEVPMDAMLIEQVLSNLMENAVIHGSSSRVTVLVERGGDWARFSVSDNGGGLAPDKLRELCADYMEMVNTSSGDKKHNMGIGLWVCRDIVKAHGGELTVRNKPAGGAEFYFSLPLKEEGHGNQRKNPGHRRREEHQLPHRDGSLRQRIRRHKGLHGGGGLPDAGGLLPRSDPPGSGPA